MEMRPEVMKSVSLACYPNPYQRQGRRLWQPPQRNSVGITLQVPNIIHPEDERICYWCHNLISWLLLCLATSKHWQGGSFFALMRQSSGDGMKRPGRREPGADLPRRKKRSLGHIYVLGIGMPHLNLAHELQVWALKTLLYTVHAVSPMGWRNWTVVLSWRTRFES
jgi:hypothetical protein